MDYGKAIFYSVAAVFSLCFLITFLIFGSSGSNGLGVVVIISSIASVIGLFGAIFISIPTHLIFKRLNIRNGMAYTVVGFVAPTVVIWTFSIVLSLLHGSLKGIGASLGSSIGFGVVLGFFGAMSLYIFWLNVVPQPSSDNQSNDVIS